MQKTAICLLTLSICVLVVCDARTDPKAPLDSADGALPVRAKGRLGSLRLRRFESPYSINLLSGDGSRLVRAGSSGEVLILDPLTGVERARVNLEKYSGPAVTAAISDDGKKLAWFDSSITSVHVHDLDTGKELQVIPGLQGCRIDSLQLSGDGSAFSLLTENPQAKSFIDVWETAGGKKLGQFQVEQNQGIQSVISNDGKLLASWGWFQDPSGQDTEESRRLRRTVDVWNVQAGKRLHRLNVEQSQLVRAEISRDGKWLLAAGAGSGLSLYSLESGNLERQVATRAGLGAFLAFAPDGSTFAAGSPTGLIQVYDTKTGKRLESTEGIGCALQKIVYTPKGKARGFGVDCQTLRFWEVPSEKTPEELTGHTGATNALQFLTDKKQIVTSSYDGRIMVWDANTHTLLKQLDRFYPSFIRANYSPPSPAEFSTDGKYLIAYSEQSQCAVYETATGKVAFDLPSGNTTFLRPAFASNKPMFGFAIQKQEQTGPESWAGVWNLETGQEMRQIKLPWPDVQAIALNPDGSTFVCARSAFDANAVPQEWVMEVAAWKVKTGKEQFKFKTSGGPVTGATYSPDGRILLVSTQSSLLWIADTETGGGRKLLPVAQGFGTFGALSFAPDGHTFAIAVQHNDPSGSIASKILVFEAASQSLRQEFSGHAAPINSLTYSADGKTLGSTSNDTTALLWDLTGIDPDKPPSDKLDRKELDALWEKLNEPIASDAFAALVRLASAPGDTTAFLREHLKPADGTERPSEEQIAKWIKNLDNDDFTAREQASADLARAGKLAEAQLKKAQDSNPSTETAVRIKRLLENIESFDEAKIILRPMRALEVLERIGTAEAREVVDNLSGGNGDAALTRAAKAALQRMR